MGLGVDAPRVSALIREVAEAVILPRFNNLAAADIREKGPNDLVTIADLDSERLLTKGLTSLLPGSEVVGEEIAAADPNVLLRLKGEAPVWILDPVDGTALFAKGDPGFAVIVALAHKGRTVAGWIHDPVKNITAITEHGQGAWLEGRRMHAAAPQPAADMTGAVWWTPAANKLHGKVRATQAWGSAGQAYIALADGRLDFAVFRRLNPWDHAAGVLMHAEAGGTNSLLDGEPYRPVPTVAPMLLAPDSTSWGEIKSILDA